MKTKLPALLLTLTLSLTACGAAPASSGSRDPPDLSGIHTLPQTRETPPVDLPTLRLTLVDGAGTDTLLLAGETAGEVYTVPADSFPLTLDGEPADASPLPIPASRRLPPPAWTLRRRKLTALARRRTPAAVSMTSAASTFKSSRIWRRAARRPWPWT